VSGNGIYGKDWADCSADWYSGVDELLAVSNFGCECGGSNLLRN